MERACHPGHDPLWFWNTEIGWASVHPVLAAHGWEYRCCNVWDKGLGHGAGNANTLTLRKFPVVTEVCAHYVKAARFTSGDGAMTMQEWLRRECAGPDCPGAPPTKPAAWRTPPPASI